MTQPILITCKSGTEYRVTHKLLSMTQIRLVLEKLRQHEQETMRLAARIEVAVRQARRVRDRAGEMDDYDAAMEMVDEAVGRIAEAQNAHDDHLAAQLTLNAYAESIKGFDNYEDLPAADYADVLEMVRKYVEGDLQGFGDSGEGQVSPTWRKVGSSKAQSTPTPS